MRIAVAFIVAIASAATIATVGRTAPTDTAPNQAKLKLMATDPITVRGLAFRRGERVSVVLRLSTDATWTQKATASQTGVFNALFSGARAGHCTGITVRATGRSGSTAVFHRIPLPACMVD